jgi:hypothetical protein
MPLTPKEWSVVVVGRWNRAILTPAGIGKRVFKLPEGTPMEVMIAIDAIAPPLVKHDKMVVVAASDRLTIQPEICSFDELMKACTLASSAVTSLPETPLLAVGFNLKYTTKGYFEPIDRVLVSELDDLASDAQYSILERQVHRAYKWDKGKINFVTALTEDDARTVSLNFELNSDSSQDHIDWLGHAPAEIKIQVQKIIGSVLQVPEEDVNYEQATQN